MGKPEGNRLLGRPRLDGIIYCGKHLDFCHGYSNARYFSFADSAGILYVRHRQLAQVSFKHLHCAKGQQHKNSASSWLCPSSVKGFGSRQWTFKSFKRRVTLLQQLLNSGFPTAISISNYKFLGGSLLSAAQLRSKQNWNLCICLFSTTW